MNDLEDFILFVKQAGITKVSSLGLPTVERYVAHLEDKGFASLTVGVSGGWAGVDSA